MDVVDLTERLVAIPSHEDESAAGEFVADWLRENTAAAVSLDDHGNVIARKGGDGESLALVGHHDVVPPDESQVDDGEYVVERRAGEGREAERSEASDRASGSDTTRERRLYGRGTADMKGSLAAAMLAFRDGTPGGGELVLASFAGEEQGGVGCQAAIDDGFSVDYAVVGEGSTGYSAPGVTDVAVSGDYAYVSSYTGDTLTVVNVSDPTAPSIEGVTGKLIADAAKEYGHRKVFYVEDKNDLPDKLKEIIRPGDIVITMGAGDIYKYGEQFVETLENGIENLN
jgi:acetylornithine deacetylase/succinyl-diaminopimelate desuccinylase-like protein